MPTPVFPSNPVLNQIYSNGDAAWIWDGSSWQLLTNAALNAVVIGNVVPGTGAFTTLSANAITGNTVAAGALTGTTLSLSGNVLSVLQVEGAPSGISVGTVGAISSAGNVIGTYYFGNGALLTGTNQYSNANVASYLPTYSGNLAGSSLSVSGNVVASNINASVGVVSSNTVTANNATVTTRLTAGAVTSTGLISTTGNVVGNFIFGNGSLLSGLSVYSNANVDAYLQTYTGNLAGTDISVSGNITGNNITGATSIVSSGIITAVGNINSGNTNTGKISASGNIIGKYYFGNGYFLTGLNVNFSNANVGAYLTSYTGNIAAGNVSATGNIAANYFVGNGQLLTGITVNTVGTLSSLSVTGNIATGNLSAVGNIRSSYFIGNGSLLTGMYSNTNVAAYLPTYSGNITAGYFIGDGSQLTNLPGAYSNANVAAYLPTYTGIVTANIVSTTGNITGNYIIGNGAMLTGIMATEVGVLPSLSVTGNIDTFNLNALGVISSLGNISTANTVRTGNLLANNVVSATGNITGGNLSSVGQIISSGNVTARVGSFFIGNGSLLTGVNAATTPASGITGNVLSPNVTTSSLQSVGTLGSLSVSGTISTSVLNASTSISSAGNIVGNVVYANAVSTTGNVTSNYFVGNGALLTGVIANTSYSNSNVAAFLPTYSGNVSGNFFFGNGSQLTGIQATTVGVLPNLSVTGNTITGNLRTSGTVSATGNITTANYFIGDGSQLTGMYSNANVSAYLPTYSGNISASYFIGNGAFITGIVANTTYNNSNVAAFLPTYTGNLAGGNLSVTGVIYGNGAGITHINGSNVAGEVATANVVSNPAQTNITSLGILTGLSVNGNVTGNYFIGNGSQLSGVTATQVGILSSLSVSGNAVIGNISTAGAVSAAGNVTGNYIIGNGALLTGLPAGYANSDVAAYLASGTDTSNIITTANISGGNLATSGSVSASGNITGNYLFGNASQLTAVPSVLTVSNWNTGNIISNTIANVTALRFNANTGITVTDLGNAEALVSLGSSFATWEVDGQANLVAHGEDIVKFVAGPGIVITTNPSANPQEIAFAANVSNISNGTSNISIVNNGNITAVVGGTTIANISSSGLSVSGNITGNYILGDGSQLTNLPAAIGNAINLGSNSQGALVSNAVTLTANTTVTNGIALLNQVLGKLVPASPTNFPGATTLAISSLSTYRMANFVQTDNTPGANKNVSGGTTVTTVRRAASYSTNSIANVGPGDSGTVVAVLNGANAGNVTLTSSVNGNGTYSNLVITNNYDYHTANSQITAGFWYVFTSQASGSVSQGWNEVYIADTATGNTNTPYWYYDASAPGTPGVGNLTISANTTSLTYSSTVGHYNSSTQFAIGLTANRLSGDMYPTSDTFVTGTAGGAFQAPVSVTYSTAGVTTPLSRNLYVSSGSQSVSTTSNIVTGFGASSTGPSVSVLNSYATGTGTFTSTLSANVLYKTGTASTMEESNVVVGGTIGSGSGLAFRIINPGSTDTPVFTGSEAAFNSQTSTLETYDATIVAAVLKHDQTNYASGYLPAGPNLSSGRTGSQYFTFKIQRSSVSKFDVKWTGTIAGLWVALPGSSIDSTSTLNGWLDMSTAYGGAGVPGANTGAGGNGSNGCALGGVAPLNSAQTNKSITATFGTESSTNATNNEIYIRIKLTSGQSVTALSLQPASN